MDVFLKRSAIVHEIRAFFHSRGYVEVETPAMQAIPGGAAAQPFKTFHNALGCEFYLRIALELYHKRLLVGGIDKLFEIGKNFRNEGLSRKHNPEFTMLEAYCAFGDYETMMKLVEEMITQVALKVLGTLKIPRPVKQQLNSNLHSAIDILNDLDKQATDNAPTLENEQNAAAFQRYKEIIHRSLSELKNLQGEVEPNEKKHEAIATEANDYCRKAIFAVIAFRKHIATSIDKNAPSEQWYEEVFAPIDRMQRTIDGLELCKIIEIDLSKWEKRKYKDLVREKTGLSNWFELSPKIRREFAIKDLRLGGDIAESYEDFEITGAVFEKLVEPTLIQPTFVTHLPRELVPLAKLSPDDPTTVEVFECCINGQEISPGYTEQNDPIAQRTTLEHQAGGEQQKLDEDFLVALEHGMPPAGGIGIGIDRLCMMLLGQESIRDVILFPQLKPK
jgi:lysyl-tRNA synthetase class 2